jgi:uncharacterized membrane protein
MEADDPILVRFRKMSRPVRVIYGRPRTFVAVLIGVISFLLLPGAIRLTTRLLVAWDVFAAIYLVLVYVMILRSEHHRIRRDAILQDDGRFVILMVAALGAFASIAAIVFELGAPHRGALQLAHATLTIALSWAAVHTIFALHYAHDYYRGTKPGGLQFPSGDTRDQADYWDFVYFSFVIGMTAQVSDVGITDKTIRRTATAHGIISFIYNTALLALMVNIAASAIAS